MAKDFIDRLNETLKQVSEWKSQLFVGYNEDAIRKVLVKKVKDHFSGPELEKLSNLLSLGSRFLPFNQTKTATRHLKRLTLLFHRILCYHREAETLSLKNTIMDMNQQNTLQFAKQYTSMGIRYLLHDDEWAREIPIRFSGKLVHYYNQGKDKRLADSDLTTEGWCLGMSVMWLGSKAQHLDFWTNHESSGPSSYRFIMAAQSIRTNRLMGSSMDDRAEFRLKRFGLKKNCTTREKGAAATPTNMARNISKSPTPYCRIGQLYTEGGGHAMAACLENSGISFMDPNIGEFFFNNPQQFIEWFFYYCAYMGYVFSTHYIESYELTQKGISDFLKKAITNRRKMMGYDDEDEDEDED